MIAENTNIIRSHTPKQATGYASANEFTGHNNSPVASLMKHRNLYGKTAGKIKPNARAKMVS